LRAQLARARGGGPARAPVEGEALDELERLVADAARGRLQRAPGRLGVARVDAETQPGDQVLDLATLVELEPGDHAVRDLRETQRTLERALHEVDAVEHRDRVVRAPAAPQRVDPRRDLARLLVLVRAFEQFERLADAALGPQVLLLALAVVADHRVRRVEDRLRRAVVLLEQNDLRAGEIL